MGKCGKQIAPKLLNVGKNCEKFPKNRKTEEKYQSGEMFPEMVKS